MEIRYLQSSDKPAVIELWRTVFPNDPPHNEPERMLEDKLAQDNLVFVAEIKGELMGACMAGYDGHRGWLYAVAVLPQARRTGAGTQLVQYAIEQLQQLGCVKVNLQIRADNTEVASFYRSLGFQVEERLSMGYLLPSSR